MRISAFHNVLSCGEIHGFFMSSEIALIPAFRPEAWRKACGSNFYDKSRKTTRAQRDLFFDKLPINERRQ